MHIIFSPKQIGLFDLFIHSTNIYKPLRLCAFSSNKTRHKKNTNEHLHFQLRWSNKNQIYSPTWINQIKKKQQEYTKQWFLRHWTSVNKRQWSCQIESKHGEPCDCLAHYPKSYTERDNPSRIHWALEFGTELRAWGEQGIWSLQNWVPERRKLQRSWYLERIPF